MLFETEFVLVFSFPAYFWGKPHGKPERIEDENVELFPLRGAVWRERVERGRLVWFDLTPAWYPFREPTYRMKYPRRGELAAAKAPLGGVEGISKIRATSSNDLCYSSLFLLSMSLQTSSAYGDTAIVSTVTIESWRY